MLPGRLIGAVVALALLAPAALSAAPNRLVLDLRLQPVESLVEGVARWTVTNESDTSIDTLPVELYANRFAAAPTWLSGLTWYRVYPGGFDAGWTRVEAAEVDGVAVPVPDLSEQPTRLELPLPAPLAPGASASVALHFRTRIPERYGPFGALDDALTLEEGYYPAPLPRPTGPTEVRLQSAQGGDALVGGVLRRVQADEPARSVRLPRGVRPSLRFAPRLTRLRCERCGDPALRAVELVRRPPARPRRATRGQAGRDPHTLGPAWDRMPDLGHVDRSGETLRTAARAVAFLNRSHPELVPERLRLVVAPLRRNLALAGEGVVWVSDRLLRMTPVERLRKFHRIALVRALYAELLRARGVDRESDEDRAWVADVVAEQLTRRFVLATYGEEEDAFDVLAPGAFLEVVDDVLYAPQMPFQTAFFNVPDDTDPARDRFDLFGHERPTGRRIYEKLRDRLGARGLDELVARYLADAQGPALRALPDAPPAPFFADWLGRYPPLDVRLVQLDSEPKDGAFVHTAVVERRPEEGPDEYVLVRFVLDDGRVQDVRTRLAPGRTEVVLRDEARLAAVYLDPRGRLVQRLPGVADDLRLDDASRADVKVLLGQIFLTASPTANAVTAQAELVIQRRFDLRHQFGLLPFVAPEKMGGALFYTYAFGPRVTAKRLAAFVTTTLRGAAIETDGGSWGPGFAAQIGVGWSDLVTVLDMQDQNVAYARLRYLNHPTDGHLQHGGQAEIYGNLLRSPHPRHGLGLRASVGTTFGDVADSERFAVGGLSEVRALGPAEWRARHRVVLGFEYRHTWTRSLDVSALRLAWWEGLQGVLFVDAALAADDISGLFEREASALGVGYGLRLHASLFGAQPTLLAVDIAWPVPLSERVRNRTGNPFGLHFHFTQTF